jgi:thiamine kinase-like enzyme
MADLPSIQSINEVTLEWFLHMWNHQINTSDNSSTSEEANNKQAPTQKLLLSEDDVASFDIHPITQGVLSSVYKISVVTKLQSTCNDDSSSSSSSTKKDMLWIAKFPRPELHLDWMFACESAFYRQKTKQLPSNNNLPFVIPQLLYASGHCLIIEGFANVNCGTLLDGCPRDKIPVLIQMLAAWHALNWIPTKNEVDGMNDESSQQQSAQSGTTYSQKPPSPPSNSFQFQYANLCEQPGMGQRLDPLQLEHLYRQDIDRFLEHISMKNNIRPTTLELLRKWKTLRLRCIPRHVRQHKCTCIHGDYHIANWLFPIIDNEIPPENSLQHQKPVLVDWATAGYGNPMIDLVFFLIVSTHEDTILQARDWIQHYYDHLQSYSHQQNGRLLHDTISISILLDWFQWAVYNQLLILVAYDSMCRNIAMQGSIDQRDTTLAHFERVNHRAILLVQTLLEWNEVASLDLEQDLGTAIEEDQAEAKQLSDKTPLRI